MPQPRGFTPSRRLQQSNKPARVAFDDDASASDGEEGEEIIDNVSDDDGAKPTPLVQRLRSRVRTGLVTEPSSELETDAEGDDEESLASPGPSSRLRSHDRGIDSDVAMGDAGRRSRSRPVRGAKRKALKALKGGESDGAEDMDVEEDVEEEGVLYTEPRIKSATLIICSWRTS